MDFLAESETVRLFVEGQRLRHGHLFSPTFGVETAQIEPVPHQIIAVYQHMLPQPRLRFLLADDAGAGKTIMTGLYIREMLNRRLIRRVLIVPPAGLVGNWKREMQTLFSLRFREVTGHDCAIENPFAGDGSDLALVSVDTLAGGRAFERLASPETAPYDLVVFDEAHKLSAYLRELETGLHEFVRTVLVESFGEGESWWVDGVPTQVRAECAKRREEDPARDEVWRYTYLLDLKTIVDKNWAAFEPILRSACPQVKSKKEFLDSIARANEIRNKVAHPIRTAVTDEDVSFLRWLYDVIKGLTSGGA